MKILAVLLLVASGAACATSRTAASPSAPKEEKEEQVALCEHGVPAESCTKCHAELVERFKTAGDWCPEHGLPESHCLRCHPGLTFVALPKLPDGADLKLIAPHGEDVPALDAHLAPGKVTLFDFYADWCAPCKTVERHVYEILQRRGDVALRKLNMVSWDTAVSKRHLSDVPELPYIIVYGKDGELVRKIAGLALDALDRAIAEGSAR